MTINERAKEDFIDEYRCGMSLEWLADNFNVSVIQVRELLIEFKNNNSYNKGYSNELFKVIAERDLNGVSRTTINEELGISVKTIRKACKSFGEINKCEKTPNPYTKINCKDLSVCPICKSKKVNLVDENNVYCMNCGNEFFKKDGSFFQINWMYID